MRLLTTTIETGFNLWYALGLTIANHGRTLVKACGWARSDRRLLNYQRDSTKVRGAARSLTGTVKM